MSPPFVLAVSEFAPEVPPVPIVTVQASPAVTEKVVFLRMAPPPPPPAVGPPLDPHPPAPPPPTRKTSACVVLAGTVQVPEAVKASVV